MRKLCKSIESMKGLINLWNTIRFVFIMGCIVGFSIQFKYLVIMYMQFYTTVSVDFRQADTTDVPAVTICAFGLIDDKELPLNIRSYKEEVDNNLDGDEGLNNPEKLILKRMTAREILNDTSITADEIVTRCDFYPKYKSDPNNFTECKDIAPIITSIYQGRKCFTYLSQLNITSELTKGDYNRTKMDYELDAVISIKFSDIIFNYTNLYGDRTFTFSVHSPYIIPNVLDTDYYKLPDNKDQGYFHFDIRFVKQDSYLLPYPFTTNCQNYSKEDGIGERSRGDCINHCIRDYTFNKCLSYYSIVTWDVVHQQEEHVCLRNESNYDEYSYALHQCAKDCKKNCVEQVVELTLIREYQTVDHNTSLSISCDTAPFTYVSHDELLTIPEFIGILGGHAHIWLGLSAIRVFNLVVYFCNRIKLIFF